MTDKPEPAWKAAIIAFLALLGAYGLIAADKIPLWIAFLTVFIPLAQGWWTRRKVMPVETIEKAGLSVKQINADAQAFNN